MKHTFKILILAGGIFALPLSSALADGKAVYEKTCKKCHAYGVLGAPKPGDKEDWATRSKQGMDVLVKHAVEGFKGNKGMMPPKGGNSALSSAEIKSAIQHMLDSSK